MNNINTITNIDFYNNLINNEFIYNNKNVNNIKYLLINNYIDINYKTNKDITPFMVACLSKDISFIEYCLSFDNLDINIQNNEGYTVLHIIIGNYLIDIFKLIIKYKKIKNINLNNKYIKNYTIYEYIIYNEDILNNKDMLFNSMSPNDKIVLTNNIVLLDELYTHGKTKWIPILYYMKSIIIKIIKTDLHEDIIKELYKPYRINKFLQNNNNIEEYLNFDD